jgi:hypothetical protein
MRRLIVANVLALLAAGLAAAQESKFPPPNLFAQQKPASKPPAVDWNTRPSADETLARRILERLQPPSPTVVCGMTMIPADPKVDAKIRVAPKDEGVKYAMRMAPPPICKAP